MTVPTRRRLPDTVRALLFDLDGVITDTARLHAQAWKTTFDAVLAELSDQAPFDTGADYERYVDGRSRMDGVRCFLASRDIELPERSDDDTALTVESIADRKNEQVIALIGDGQVDAYPGSVRFLREARGRGLRCGLVSSSANARAALESVGLDHCFDAWVDGVRIEAEGIPGKPQPDTFLTAAADLGVDARDAAVFEDAEAGVAAGHAGGFGCVIGVDRVGHAEALRDQGADIVVTDLDELGLPA